MSGVGGLARVLRGRPGEPRKVITYIYIYVHVYLSLSLSLYIYIYIHVFEDNLRYSEAA